jgi:hypothetical protein
MPSGGAIRPAIRGWIDHALPQVLYEFAVAGFVSTLG